MWSLSSRVTKWEVYGKEKEIKRETDVASATQRPTLNKDQN